MENIDLKHKTVHAVLWTVVRVGSSNVVSFVVFMVLARTLSSRDFGIFALAILVVDIARIVASAGLSDAIVRDTAHDEILADTAFWANFALGCIIGGLTWILAPVYAATVADPRVTSVVRCLALLVPVASLSGIHTARKLGEFGHKAVAARVISSSILAGGAAVAAAIAGLGVWSLVIQSAISDFVGIVFAWQTYPWCPRARFDHRRLRQISGFSGTMMMTQVLGLLLTRIQDVVIGRHISVAAVGTYRVAWRMIDLIAQLTIHPMVGVSFVSLSQLQQEPERFRYAFLRMLGCGALLTFPAMAGFGVLSKDLIPFLFGSKWAASADIVRILTLMAVPFCMNFFIGPALAAIGRSATIAKGSIVQTTATLGLALLAAPFGLRWVAAAFVLRAYLTMPYYLTLFRRDTGIGFRAMVRAVLPPFAAALGMAAVLLIISTPLRRWLGPGAPYLASAAVLGSIVFFGWLIAFSPRYVRSCVDAVSPIWGRRVRVLA
jgi:O-antigen/teichoic acid export membrane protein